MTQEQNTSQEIPADVVIPPLDSNAGPLSMIGRVREFTAKRDYPDGRTPVAALEGLLGRPVSEEEVGRYSDDTTLMGFNAVGIVDADLPAQILSKYGKGFLASVGLELLHSGRPINITKMLTEFAEEPVPTQTGFFREPNLEVFAEGYAEQYAATVGRGLRIAEVGCGEARETWSLAACLRDRGVAAHIDGLDVSERALAMARQGGPYPRTASAPSMEIPERHASYFQGDETDGISPVDELQTMATFREGHDIAEQPLEPDYDAVVAFNMLWHYPLRRRERMLANMLSGLRPGGFFIFEGPIGGQDAGSSRGYRKWAADLQRLGLVSPEEAQVSGSPTDGGILVYQPSLANRGRPDYSTPTAAA